MSAAQEETSCSNSRVNYELAVRILGWESTEVMKKSYGKMPDEERTIGLMGAMCLPVVKAKREFLF